MHVDSWGDSYLEHGGTPKPLLRTYMNIYVLSSGPGSLLRTRFGIPKPMF